MWPSTQEGGAQHEEGGLAVLLELRPLVGVARVLDRELVQAELLLQPPELGSSGSWMPIQTKWPGLAAHAPLSSIAMSWTLRPAL